MSERLWGYTVPILGSAMLLALVAIASFPCWPYSRRFGYAPSTSAGVLLVLVALLAVNHKSDVIASAGEITKSSSVSD
jgi:Protein of unknown function (DUF3309)